MDTEQPRSLNASDLPLEGEKAIMEDNSNTEEKSARSIQLGDLPVEGGSQIMRVATSNKRSPKKKRRLVIGSVVLLLILIGVAVGLGVALTKGKQDDTTGMSQSATSMASSGDKTVSATPVPTSAPTEPARTLLKLADVKAYVKIKQISSVEDVERDDSPQAKAALFMAEDSYPVPTSETFYNETIFWMERYAMVVFYYSTEGSGWIYDYNFLTPNVTICGWGRTLVKPSGYYREGIGCTRDGRVLDITLERNNLTGSLPGELGFLSEMKYFSIVQNSVTGKMPARVKYWKQLIFFDARMNSMEGRLPSWIDNWSALRILALSGNKLTGTIPSGMKNLTELQQLFLDDNIMEGSLENLENNKKLISLYLEDNAFTQNVDSTFLADLSLLRRLDVSDNELYGGVPVHLFSGGSLDVLDIHGNSITSFPDSIPKGNSTLGFLALQFNPLAGTFPTNTISNLEKIDHLDLTSTSIFGTMPGELSNLSKLKYLFLADTAFSPGPIPDEFEKLTDLQDLSLKHSSRDGPIPPWIDSLYQLILLDLDNNDLSGTIPVVMGNMTSLNFLLLHRNLFKGTVPEELGNLKRMKYLFLDHNELTGDIESICGDIPRMSRTTSDCGAPTYEIGCTCCTVCCDDDEESSDCNLHGENDFLALLEPQWTSNYNRIDYSDFFPQYIYQFSDYNVTR